MSIGGSGFSFGFFAFGDLMRSGDESPSSITAGVDGSNFLRRLRLLPAGGDWLLAAKSYTLLSIMIVTIMKR